MVKMFIDRLAVWMMSVKDKLNPNLKCKRRNKMQLLIWNPSKKLITQKNSSISKEFQLCLIANSG